MGDGPQNSQELSSTGKEGFSTMSPGNFKGARIAAQTPTIVDDARKANAPKTKSTKNEPEADHSAPPATTPAVSRQEKEKIFRSLAADVNEIIYGEPNPENRTVNQADIDGTRARVRAALGEVKVGVNARNGFGNATLQSEVLDSSLTVAQAMGEYLEAAFNRSRTEFNSETTEKVLELLLETKKATKRISQSLDTRIHPNADYHAAALDVKNVLDTYKLLDREFFRKQDSSEVTPQTPQQKRFEERRTDPEDDDPYRAAGSSRQESRTSRGMGQSFNVLKGEVDELLSGDPNPFVSDRKNVDTQQQRQETFARKDRIRDAFSYTKTDPRELEENLDSNSDILFASRSVAGIMNSYLTEAYENNKSSLSQKDQKEASSRLGNNRKRLSQLEETIGRSDLTDAEYQDAAVEMIEILKQYKNVDNMLFPENEVSSEKSS